MGRGLSRVRQENKYLAIQSLHQEKGYPLQKLCEILQLNRSSYYKWLKRDQHEQKEKDQALIQKVCALQQEYNGILGYRRMQLYLFRRFGMSCNRKRVYRVMHAIGMKAVIRKKRPGYIRSTPEVTAENILGRDFAAQGVNEKWLTDVTEFKCGNGEKLYLSAILDIKDNSIVSYQIGRSNNNSLAFSTFNLAVEKYPDAHPIFHSDRGFQYTSKMFKAKLDKQGMTQSMSRIGHCIDNGPMEAFWGTLKAEMYYLRPFPNYESLKKAIEEYIHFYNHSRYQFRLGGLAPMEYRTLLTGTA